MTNNGGNVPNTTNVDFSGQSSKTPEQDNSAPMAVLPLNSSAKLDQEPNPFEQSFSTVNAPYERPNYQQQYLYENNSNKRSESLSSSTSTTTSNSSGNCNNQQQKTILPPVAAITSPAPPLLRSGVLPKDIANQIAWNSLRAGPLSPSMLQGPQKPPSIEVNNNNHLPSTSSPPSCYPSLSNSTTTVTTSSQQQQQQSHHSQRPMSHIYAPDPALSFAMASPAVDEVAPNGSANARSNSMSSSASAISISPTAMTHSSNNNLMNSKQGDRRPSEPSNMEKQHDTNSQFYEDNYNDTINSNGDTVKTKKRARSTSNVDKDEDDKKRKSFLERNRIAALKCRQRKKQWLNNLQAKVEYLTNDNEQLQIQSNALREEIVNLKTLLLAHKDCPIAQQQQQGVFLELQQEQQQQHNHNNHNQNKTSSSVIHPSAEAELIPIGYSSATSSTTINNTNNSNNNNTTNSMQQNMMTFSSHPQAQSMVAGTSSVLRF